MIVTLYGLLIIDMSAFHLNVLRPSTPTIKLDSFNKKESLILNEDKQFLPVIITTPFVILALLPATIKFGFNWFELVKLAKV